MLVSLIPNFVSQFVEQKMLFNITHKLIFEMIFFFLTSQYLVTRILRNNNSNNKNNNNNNNNNNSNKIFI